MITILDGEFDVGLTSARILVGNASNVAAEVDMTGDVTIDNAGATTVRENVALAGNPTTTTQSPGDSSTRIATTAFVGAAVAPAAVGATGITVDGAGSVITTGSKGYITIPFNGTIDHWYLVADVAGGTLFDVKRSAASIIGAGNKPALSSQASANAAVSGWISTAIVAGDILEFIVESSTTVTRVNLVLKITKTS